MWTTIILPIIGEEDVREIGKPVDSKYWCPSSFTSKLSKYDMIISMSHFKISATSKNEVQ